MGRQKRTAQSLAGDGRLSLAVAGGPALVQ
jgi:hypothetical protein